MYRFETDRRRLLAFVIFLILPVFILGQKIGRSPDTRRTASEQLEAARKNPLALRAFLVTMPKGADLHNHLSGAVYAESFIRAAAEDNLCVDPSTDSFAKADSVSEGNPPQVICNGSQVPAAQAFKDQHLYDALVDAFSMRAFVPSSGISGHDHFFDTFAKFGGTDVRHIGEWLDEVATRAAGQNEQYMELMATPTAPRLANIVKEVGWHDDFMQQRDELLAHGLREDVATARGYWEPQV